MHVLAHEATKILPEIFGGFIGFWLHSIQHRLFALASRLLPKGWRK